MASSSIVYRLIAHDSASRTFNTVGRSASGAERTLTKLGQTAVKVGAAMAAGLAVGLGESVKKAGEFQSEMTRISTQAGATAKDVKVLSDQVLKLGTTTQQGPKKLADSLYHLKSVGMDNVSAMKALKEASDLAAVGHADLEETTNALAGAWRTGIKGAGSFHEAVSTVNAIIGAGNMSMEQFNAAIGTGILPSAKTFGLSMKQVGAALALMTDEGIDSASAATRLRMSFSLLGAPSKAAEKQLGKIGLTGLQLADAMRGPDGLIGAIQLLKDHLDKSGLSASQQSQILSRAFGGGRSSSGILMMINNLDVLKKKQDQVNRSTGKFDDAVKMQRKTAEAQWHLLTSNLEVMGVRVGTKVLPYVTDFVHFLATDAMPAAAKFGTAVGNLIPVDGIKRRLGEAKALFTDFYDGLSGKAVKNVATPRVDKGPVMSMPKTDAAQFGTTIHDAIAGGFKDIDWGNLGSILGKGLGDAIGWVGKHIAGFTKKIADIFGKLDFVQIGKGFGRTALPLAIGFITSLFEPLFSLDFWKKHWLDTIIAVVSVIPIGRLASGLGKVFEHIPFLKVFEPLLRGVGRLGGWIEKGLGKVFGPIGRGIASGFKKAFPAAGSIAKDLLERLVLGPARRLKTAAGLIPRAVGSGIERGTAWVTEKVLTLGKAILRPFARAGGWLLGKGADLVKGFGRGVSGAAKGIGGFAWRWVGKPVVDAFKGAGSWLIGKGKSLVSGFKSGSISVAKTIGSWSKKNVIDPVTGAFKSSGSWLYSRGKSLVGGFKSGSISAAKGIAGFTNRTVISPVTGAFKGAGSWLWSKGKSLVSGFKSGSISAARGVAGWANRTIISPVTGAFKHAGSWLYSKGKALLSGLKDGIVGGIKGIGHWIKSNLIDPVVNAVKHFFGIHSPSTVFAGIGGHLIGGLLKGMASTSGTAIAHKIFGDLPHALSAIVHKGLVNVSKLPGKALKALGSIGDSIGLGDSSASGSAQQFAQGALKSYGWGPSEWPALKALWQGESGWNYKAKNASSGAYGIPQALPASKMASAGSDWRTNAATQIRWGLGYIKSVYGSPNSAYSKWQARSPHWYAKGTGGAARGLAWVGEKGPELVNFKGGETVWNNADSMSLARSNGIRLPGYAKGTTSAKNATKSIANQLANGFLKQLATGTSSAIASVLKSLTSKLLNAGYNKLAKSVLKAGEKLEKLADKRDAIRKQIAAAKQYASDQTSNIKDFLSISGTSATDVGSLIGQMKGQQKTASSFVALTKSLQARGASKELLQQLSDAGPGSQLATILGQKNVTTTDISKLNTLVASGGKLATSFGKDMADMMYDTGKNAGKGFLAGLQATEKDLTKQMDKLAVDLVKAIKKALKIKSPSGVFRDEIGKQVVLGMAHGIDQHSHLVGSAAQRLADTATGVSMRRRYVPTPVSGRSAAGHEEAWERLAAAIEASGQEVHVHFNDDRLRDLIDVQVKPKIKASANQQAYRARVGRRSG